VSIVLEGVEGAARIGRMMKSLRENRVTQAGGLEVTKIIDYKDGYEDIPASNVLRIFLEDDTWFAVRPSGTEPKIKFYFYAKGKSAEEAAEINERVRTDVVARVQSIE